MTENELKKTLDKCLVLVVDDEEDALTLFKFKLRKMACKVMLANNADDAVSLYKQALHDNTPVDIVILDLNLKSGINGVDVASTLHEIDSSAKIVVSSGHTEGPEMMDFKKYGFDAALEKNYNYENMKSLIESLLSQKHQD